MAETFKKPRTHLLNQCDSEMPVSGVWPEPDPFRVYPAECTFTFQERNFLMTSDCLLPATC